MRKRKSLYLLIAFEVIIFLCIAGAYLYMQVSKPNLADPLYQNLPTISAEELAKYDGSSPDLPIYVAVNGLVYDVTTGKRFYEPGGSYHYIAGKDATQDLGPFASAITGKYQAVKRLE